MNSSDDFTGPVNLGNPVEYAFLELTEMIIKLMGSKFCIVHNPLLPDDLTHC